MRSVRRNPWPLALLLFLAGVLSSCRDTSLDSQQIVNRKSLDVRTALSRAEVLMESDPHAARALLDSIAYPHPLPKGKGAASGGNQSPLLQEGTGEAAYYAWLRTQVNYKCYVPLTSDSLARIATDYYGVPRRPDYHAAMAWYTLGCVYTDQSTRGEASVEQAFDAYLKARPLFPDRTNRYYALCCQNIGRCYRERTLYRDAIREYEESKRASIAGGDSIQVYKCDANIGYCHLALNEFAAADSCYQASLANPYADGRHGVLLLLDMAKLDYYYRHDADAAIHKLHTYIRRLSRANAVGAAYYLLGTIYDHQQRPDSATYYYEKSFAERSNTPYTLYNLGLSEHALYLRQHADSVHARRFQQFVALSDTLFTSRNRAQLTAVENDHRHALDAERAKRRQLLTLGTVVLLFMTLLWYATYLLRRKDAQYIKVSDALRAAQLREEQAKARTTFHDAVGVAVRQFTSGPAGQLMTRLREGHGISPSERIALCHELGACFADVFALLQQEGHTLNNREQLVTASYAVGFNSEDAETVLHIKDSTIRSHKKRIKDRLPAEFGDQLFPSK